MQVKGDVTNAGTRPPNSQRGSALGLGRNNILNDGGYKMNTSIRNPRYCSMFLAVIVLLSLAAMAQQSSSSSVLYDNFNRQFLDPNKWQLSSPCFTWTVLECVREIQNGQLRLAVRGYGATDSNAGNQYGESELLFVNPSNIKSILAQVTVRRTTAANCPASADFNSGTQVLVKGSFFNSGSGNPFDDVQAFVLLNRLPTDPPGVLSAIGFLNWQGQFFDNIDLGTVNVGQHIALRLTWNQKGHQFIAARIDLASGAVQQASMPYTISDTALAAAPFKSLQVAVFTPNCVGPQMLVDDVETTFDNVAVGNTE